MPVHSSFRCAFDVADLDKYSSCNSSPVPVIYKDVRNHFGISLGLDSPHMVVYLTYLDGPNAEVCISYELFFVTDTGSLSVGKVNDIKLTRESVGNPTNVWPRSVDSLAIAGYLKSNNTILEIEAVLKIPEEAFHDHAGSHIVFTLPQINQPDLYRLYLFKQLTTPAATNEPFCDRFELRSMDGSFWAHRSVLALKSDVFKEWLDPSKQQQDSNSGNFNFGGLDIDCSNEGLRHILHFIYLDETATGFRDYALEIVQSADRYRFNHLKRTCERSLLGFVDEMTLSLLFECLKTSDTFGLEQLRIKTVTKMCANLDIDQLIINDQEEFVLDVLKYAQQHEYIALKDSCGEKIVSTLDFTVDSEKFLQMVTIARNYELQNLAKWCESWIAKNYKMFKNEGYLEKLMKDESDDGHGVIDFMMTRLCKFVFEQSFT